MKISVIIITYKAEAYFRQCLESVCAQTHKDLEVIVVIGHDPQGSDDACPAIAAEFAASDPRIKIVECTAAGVSDARNRGLAAVTGDLIGFVDADDHIAPEMYEELAFLMHKYTADIAICGRFYEYKNTILSDRPYPDGPRLLTGESALRMVLEGNGFYLHSWDKLYRKSLWEGITFPEGKYVEDRVTINRVLGRAEITVYDPYPRYYYRERLGSMSKSGGMAANNHEANEELVRYIKEYFPALGELCDRYMIYETITALQNVYLEEGTGREERDRQARFFRSRLKEMKEKTGQNRYVDEALRLKYWLALHAPGVLVQNTRLRNMRQASKLERFT